MGKNELRTIKSITSRTGAPLSDTHKDILGCRCMLSYIGMSAIFSVSKSNSGKSKSVTTSNVVSLKETDGELEIITENSIYLLM